MSTKSVKSSAVLTFLGLAMFIYVVDTTIMSVSMSNLVVDLKTDISWIQMAITVYTLTMAAFMATGAKLGAIWGPKRAFQVGLVIYGIGTVMTSVAPNIFILLLGWSVLEGLGSALIVPAISTLIRTNLAEDKRASAYGIIGGVAAAGAAVGPIVGGWLATSLTWRVAFIAEAIIVVIVLFGSRKLIEAHREGRLPKMDYGGAILSALGMGLFVFGILQTGTLGWGSSLVWFLMVSGLFILWWFARRSLRREAAGEDTLIRLSILFKPSMRSGTPVIIAQNFLQNGMLYLMPLYVQLVLSFDALQTGLVVLPLSIAIMVFAATTAKLGHYIYPRTIIQFGMLLLIVGGAILYVAIPSATTGGDFALAMFTIGAAIGLIAAQLPNLMLSGVESDETSEAAGIQGTAQNLGMSLGTAVAGSVIAVALIGNLNANVTTNQVIAETEKTEILTILERNSETLGTELETLLAEKSDEVRQEVGQIAKTSGDQSFQLSVFVMGLIGLFGYLFTFGLPKRKLGGPVIEEGVRAAGTMVRNLQIDPALDSQAKKVHPQAQSQSASSAIKRTRRFWSSWSFVGLFVGAIFLAISLSPSLVPRPFMLQGVVSGLTLALGYGLGSGLVWIWKFLELPELRGRLCGLVKVIMALTAGVTLSYFYSQATVWQNSIRSLMEMSPVEDGALVSVTGIALALALLLIFLVRGLKGLYIIAAKQVHRFVPRRVSYLVGAVVLTVLLVNLANGVLVSRVIDAVDGMYASVDQATPDGLTAPNESTRSGSPDSLVQFENLGKAGKEFVSYGPRAVDIEEFSGESALEPIRVYVGLPAAESTEEQAELALQELKRTNAFDRSVLVIATPTGTGWVDAGAADTLEYLHNGDTAIVGVQYSYLSSPVTLILDPARAQNSARIVFETIYDYWRSLPQDERPDLYLYGLSLGSYGSEQSAQLYTLLDDPISGAFWVGPPFANSVWPGVMSGRNEGTPAWLPEFEDGSLIRFLGQDNSEVKEYADWGSLRIVYLLYPSDAIVFWRDNLWYKEPDWLAEERGADISPFLSWYPFVTFWQVGLDMLVTTNVPFGYGHNYDPKHYLEGWVELTEPADWSEEDTERLQAKL